MNDCLEFPTQVSAQSAADALHARMIALDPDYAKSVANGQTVAWAIPYEIDGRWYVNVKDRGRKAVDDKVKLKPIIKPVAK